jgi:hypothetical protein
MASFKQLRSSDVITVPVVANKQVGILTINPASSK